MPILVLQVDGFIVAVKIKCRRTLLLWSETGVFGSAEGELVLDASAGKVNSQQARFGAIHEIEDARNIGCLNRGGETQRNIVRDAHGVVKVFSAHHGKNRPKNLFPGDSHIFGHVRKNRWGDEPSFVISPAG